MTIAPAPVAYTIDELLELLPISRTTVRRRIADGTIPAIRIGRRVCIPRTWVADTFGAGASSSTAAATPPAAVDNRVDAGEVVGSASSPAPPVN